MSAASPDIIDTAVKIGGWIVSAAMFVWIMSRRTQGWDRGNQSWLTLHGDKDSKDENERRGLIETYRDARREDIERIEKLENIVLSMSDRMRAIQDGLGAHGSRSDIIAANLRRSLSDMAHEAAAVRDTRKALVTGQYFPVERERESFPAPEPPSLPQPPRPRLDPRRETDDTPFRPDDTGRFRGRKKP